MKDTVSNIMTTSTPAICPYLGLADDRTVVRTAPDAGHRCYALTPPGAPSAGHQGAYCLASGHTACPFYVAPQPDAAPAGRTRRSPAPRSGGRWPWLGGLLGLLLLAVLSVYAWEALRPPAPSAPSPVAAHPTAASPTPRRSPAPTASPAATRVQPVAAPRYNTPTAEPAGRILELTAKGGNAGWWTGGEARGNHLGDSFLYAGYFEGQPFVSAILFDLAALPRGAPIRDATLRLTGLQAERFDRGAGGTWSVQLLAPKALQDAADNPARVDFRTIFNAPAEATLFPTLYPADLAPGQVNTLALDASAREWLARQAVDGVPYVIARITGPTGGGDTLFAWDSGAGPATASEAPKLVLALGPTPPTPPPLPTEAVIIATLTATPANVLTVAAQAQTATAVATAIGTPTRPAVRLVTPTPIAANMATAQALAFALGLPPLVVSTPAPANAATATYQADYATAVAVTTGTFTPVPTDAVTPVVVLPTPIPKNVVTAAAQMRAATAQAAAAGPAARAATPLPYNAVIATLTPEPIVLLNTPTPENAATAQAQAAYATAVAAVVGTFTPLPSEAVRATNTPEATPIPLLLYIDQLPPTPKPSPTAALAAAPPRELMGKILFISDRDGGEPRLFALDPKTGRLAYVTQSWPYSLALAREARAPDGHLTAIVQDDSRRVPQVHIRDPQFNSVRQLTTATGMSYDPVWSPAGDLIALVSEEPGNAEIYTIRPDGSDFKRLTANNWEWDKHPSFSPDGSQIVFWSNRDTGRRQLWVMNADGSGQRPLMSSPYNDWDPIWVK